MLYSSTTTFNSFTYIRDLFGQINDLFDVENGEKYPFCDAKPWQHLWQHLLTKPAKHTGPGVPRWRWWLQNFIDRIYCVRDPVLFRSVVRWFGNSMQVQYNSYISVIIGLCKNSVLRRHVCTVFWQNQPIRMFE